VGFETTGAARCFVRFFEWLPEPDVEQSEELSQLTQDTTH
jgi:hypothetical protein